jgi:hypothetical protein
MTVSATRELQKVIQDQRYTIALEFTGLPEKTWVVRFCNNFIGQGQTVNKAILQAVFHQGERLGLL